MQPIKLNRQMFKVPGSLADIWERTHEPREHGERMAGLACAVAERMGLAQSQVQDLYLLAIVHDFGKAMIKKAILDKEGPLDELEWDEIKMHPIYGYKIAKLNPDISHVAEGILFHHERWDGQGYPYGLSGTDIPVIARIVAAVDAYDAMNHDRSYRPAMSAEEALLQVQMFAGRKFDPAVVDALTAVVNRPG